MDEAMRRSVVLKPFSMMAYPWQRLRTSPMF